MCFFGTFMKVRIGENCAMYFETNAHRIYPFYCTQIFFEFCLNFANENPPLFRTLNE